MKKGIIIIIFLVVSLLAAFHCKSQTRLPEPIDTVLLSDETDLIYYKSEAKIVSTNEKAFNLIFKSHGQLFSKFRCKWIHGKGESYKEYTAILSLGDAEIIKQWSIKNL